MMPRHFTGSTERHFTDGNAIAADLHYGREPGDHCTGCGKPFGIADDGRWITISASFSDLCEDCGDDVQARMEER